MRIDVITIFPELVEHYASAALLGRARASGVLDLRVHDLRSSTTDRHRSVDDAPFGGGPGMVIAAGPVAASVEAAAPCRPLFLLGPGGRRLDQQFVEELAGMSPAAAAAGEQSRTEPAEHAGRAGFSLLCGRYEGVDHRVLEHIVDGELSIGDYVLAGGELAALVVVEAVTRLLPGAMGNDVSPTEESFSAGLLEYPQYTRPAVVNGWAVPPVLLSGDHGRIARWRHAEALRRTIDRRPDLIVARGGVQPEEALLLGDIDRLRGSAGDQPPEGQPTFPCVVAQNQRKSS